MQVLPKTSSFTYIRQTDVRRQISTCNILVTLKCFKNRSLGIKNEQLSDFFLASKNETGKNYGSDSKILLNFELPVAAE